MSGTSSRRWPSLRFSKRRALHLRLVETIACERYAMKPTHRAIPLAVLIFILIVWPAHADVPFVTLVGNGRAEYRFDYRGDRTRIDVALDAPGVNGVALYVYTPAQLQSAQRGGDLTPVGRGTPGGGHDSFWSGSFNTPGVYHVAVENQTPGVILYRLSITGESVSGAGQILAEAPPATSNLSAYNTLTVGLPPGAGTSTLSLRVHGAPASCTHAYEVDTIVSHSLKLCPNEIYPPIHLVGNNLAVYADDAHSAIITSAGRQFALTLDGSYNFVEGVTIQAHADAADVGAWLCQYDECIFPTQPRRTVLNGGIVYGGGILLRGSHTTIHGVTVHGGTIGIATVNGTGNNLLDNQLNDLNGWGVFNVSSTSSNFVGNTLNRNNHACTTPDGYKFLHGCETAGWVCLGCSGNLIARNHCESSANCFYMSGERGLGSHNNKLIANYCAGATDHCFELTFSRGNLLQDNVTTADPNTGGICNYPFWIGGSSVYFKNNLWQCAVSVDDALARATASTSIPTVALFGNVPYVPSTPASTNAAASPPLPRPGRQIRCE